jgi:hypothetical protein
MPSLSERKKLISGFDATKGVVSGGSMRNFRFILFAIENFMQDFLAGDFTNYNASLTPMDANQKKIIGTIASFR